MGFLKNHVILVTYLEFYRGERGFHRAALGRSVCHLSALALFCEQSEVSLKFLPFIFTALLMTEAAYSNQSYRVGRKIAQNQSGEDAQAPKTGRQKAQEYFQSDVEKTPRSSANVSSDDHYLAIHASTYMNSETWLWGQKDKQKDTGKSGFGVTYRFDEWGQTDLDIRFELNEFKVVDQKPVKFTILPVIVFPEAGSQFPLYFGAGAGLGVFFKQIDQESNLSFDYQLFMGARFFNVVGSTGFFIETGIKNHVHILSDGQFNGTYLALGALFTF